MEFPPVTVFIDGEVVTLPVGSRFHPNDEELVNYYLKKKLRNEEIPATLVPEVDVFDKVPWELPGHEEVKRYYFSKINEGDTNGNARKIMVGCGFWKSRGQVKEIISSENSEVIGTKRKLEFWKIAMSQDKRTDWVMHEMRLAESEADSQLVEAQTGVSHIFRKNEESNIEASENIEEENISSTDCIQEIDVATETNAT